MPDLKTIMRFFDISLGSSLLYWLGFSKATRLICPSFSNYKKLIQKLKMK
jgi:hypothetical protein